MNYYKQNFLYGTLNTSINNSVTSMTMVGGHNFPFDETKYFKLIIWDAATYPNPADDPNLEIVTAHWSGSGSVFTITRGEESTTAVTHAAGSSCAGTITAGLIDDELSSKQFKKEEYTTPGTYSWVCPANIHFVKVSMVGGGGGGAKDYDSIFGAGGSGAYIGNRLMIVTPGNSYEVVVGSKGLKASSYPGNGTAGGSSSFTDDVGTKTVGGGGGGTTTTGGSGGTSSVTGGNYVAGESGSSSQGGSGGNSILGAGGTGNTSTQSVADGKGYGSGGAGGRIDQGYVSGDGAPGCVIIEY